MSGFCELSGTTSSAKLTIWSTPIREHQDQVKFDCLLQQSSAAQASSLNLQARSLVDDASSLLQPLQR
jgi:hypothetical protein